MRDKISFFNFLLIIHIKCFNYLNHKIWVTFTRLSTVAYYPGNQQIDIGAIRYLIVQYFWFLLSETAVNLNRTTVIWLVEFVILICWLEYFCFDFQTMNLPHSDSINSWRNRSRKNQRITRRKKLSCKFSSNSWVIFCRPVTVWSIGWFQIIFSFPNV